MSENYIYAMEVGTEEVPIKLNHIITDDVVLSTHNGVVEVHNSDNYYFLLDPNGGYGEMEKSWYSCLSDGKGRGIVGVDLDSYVTLMYNDGEVSESILLADDGMWINWSSTGGQTTLSLTQGGASVNDSPIVTLDDVKITTNALSWGTTVELASIGDKKISAKLPAQPKASVSDKSDPLSWNTSVTLATVDGTAITAKLPAQPSVSVTNNARSLSYTGATTIAKVANTDITIGALPKASSSSYGGVKVYAEGNILKIYT